MMEPDYGDEVDEETREAYASMLPSPVDRLLMYNRLKAMAEDPKDVAAREASMLSFQEVATALGTAIEPSAETVKRRLRSSDPGKDCFSPASRKAIDGRLMARACELTMALVGSLPVILERLSDKKKPVMNAAESLIGVMGTFLGHFYFQMGAASPKAEDAVVAHVQTLLMPVLLKGLGLQGGMWQSRLGALQLIESLVSYGQALEKADESLKPAVSSESESKSGEDQTLKPATTMAPKRQPLALSQGICACLIDLVPKVTELMHDMKDPIKEAAKRCLEALCHSAGNRDIEPFVKPLISCLATRSEVPDCVHLISATTFVQTVGSQELAIMQPLLLSGLRERMTATKRKTALIIANLAKLVEVPVDAAPFLPKLMPSLRRPERKLLTPNVVRFAVEPTTCW